MIIIQLGPCNTYTKKVVASSCKLEVARLHLEPKKEPGAAWGYIGSGDTQHRKNIHWKGGLCTYRLDEGNNWGRDKGGSRKFKGD